MGHIGHQLHLHALALRALPDSRLHALLDAVQVLRRRFQITVLRQRQRISHIAAPDGSDLLRQRAQILGQPMYLPHIEEAHEGNQGAPLPFHQLLLHGLFKLPGTDAAPQTAHDDLLLSLIPAQIGDSQIQRPENQEQAGENSVPVGRQVIQRLRRIVLDSIIDDPSRAETAPG